ncbi:MAG: polysaccharide deacetylase family protein [Alphaproteobacteria bacterium]
MNAGAWNSLERELDAWASAGRVAALWWRDDDAIDTTARLARLVALGAAQSVPLMLAVIPATATAALASALVSAPVSALADVKGAVLQHGYAHINHAPPGLPKSELSNARPLADRLADLEAGRARLGAMVGTRLLPVLVPPWNRIDDDLVDALAGLGYRVLSTFRPRPRGFARPGLRQVNTHVDLIDWAGTRQFIGTDAAVAALVDHLAAKRAALAAGQDDLEPTGILSHHLAMDEPCWNFLESLFRLTRGHRGARWLDAAEIFQ